MSQVSEMWKDKFFSASQGLFQNLKEGEVLSLSFSGEESTFARFNHSKVRQVSHVEQADIELYLAIGQKNSTYKLEISSGINNSEKLNEALMKLRAEVISLPEDPFFTPFSNNGESEENYAGQMATIEEMTKAICELTTNCDLAGHLVSGEIFTGSCNSLGQKHWFSNNSYFFDYSLYTAKEKAVKGFVSGTEFKLNDLSKSIQDSISALNVIDCESLEIKPGKYRVYLAPEAVSEIVSLMGWGSFSGSADERGVNPLGKLKKEHGGKKLSPLLSMTENFQLGLGPRFNEIGEVSQEKINLIKNGELENLLVNASTEKEFGIKSNQASHYESPRSLDVETGDLEEENILKELGTGLYLSNLHYLNYSDRIQGRLTGMTRFGCLWVENGKIVGPIKDLRFDETLFHMFGDALKKVTNFSKTTVETSTYYRRHLGGHRVPGMIIDDFSFTL